MLNFKLSDESLKAGLDKLENLLMKIYCLEPI